MAIDRETEYLTLDLGDTFKGRRGEQVRIMLPALGPTLTPALAKALVRLFRNATSDESCTD